MEDLVPLISSAQEVWKEFDLTSKKESWNKEVHDRLESFKDDSARAKRRLGEQTKELRAMSNEDKLKGMGSLIRAYQEEIDKSGQRCVFVETMHSSMWSVLQRAPDPTVLLNTTMKAIKDEESEKQRLAAESYRARKELATKTKQLEELSEKVAQGTQSAQDTQDAHGAQVTPDKRLAAALKKVEEMEREQRANVEQFKRAAAAFARVGELERVNAELEERVKVIENERNQLPRVVARESPEEGEKVHDDGALRKLEQLSTRLEEAVEDRRELKEAFEQERERAKAAETAVKQRDEKLQQFLDTQRRVEELETSARSHNEVVQRLQMSLVERDELVETLQKNVQEAVALSSNNQELEKYKEEAERYRDDSEAIKIQLEKVTLWKINLEKQKEEESEERGGMLEELRAQIDNSTEEAEVLRRDLQEAKQHIAGLQALVDASKAGAEDNSKEREELMKTLHAKLQETLERSQALSAKLDEKEQSMVQLQAELSSKDNELSAALQESQELVKAVAESGRKIGELEKKQEEAISENLLHQELIQQQLHTIAQLKGEEEEEGKPTSRGTTPRGTSNFQDQLVEELTELVATLRASTEQLTVDLRERDEECAKLRELIKEKDERITGLMDSDNSVDLSEELEEMRSTNQQLSAEVSDKSLLVEQLKGEVSGRDERIIQLTEVDTNSKQAVKEKEERIRELEDSVSILEANLKNEKAKEVEQEALEKQLREKEERIRELEESESAKGLDHQVLEKQMREKDQRIRDLEEEEGAKSEGQQALEQQLREKEERIRELEGSQNVKEELERHIRENEQRIRELEENESTKSEGQEALEEQIREKEQRIRELEENEKTKEELERCIREKEERIRELEENESNVRTSIGTAEGHTLELTQQLEQLNANVRQLEVQLDKAKQEGREKDERMAEALARMEAERDEKVRALEVKDKQVEGEIKKKEEEVEGERRRREEEIQGEKRRREEEVEEARKEIELVKAQNSALLQNALSLQATTSSQSNKTEELQRLLDAREEDLALKGRSNDLALVETKRKLEEKDLEMADLRAKHAEGIKQLVAQNSELLVQSERYQSIQSDLERNVTELANSYRHLSERSETDTQQFQEASATSTRSIKTLQSEIDALRREHEEKMNQLKSDYEAKTSTKHLSESAEMHDITLNERHEEVVKEAQLMRQHLHQLESDLENMKEELRRKNEQVNSLMTSHSQSRMGAERSMMVAEAEAGDVWSRMGGSGTLCYAPVAAMSYWRRWMGRPDDVHNS